MVGFNWTAGVIRTVLAVIMAFLFQPMRRWITKVTDKIFFKNAYDPETFLDTMSHTIGGSIVLIELLYKTLKFNHFPNEGQPWPGNRPFGYGKIYTTQSMGYKVSPKILEEDIHKMVKDGTLVYDELEETSHFKHLMRKYDASLVVPLKTDSDTEALLILGEKLSGDMYSAGDFGYLKSLRRSWRWP